MTEELKTKLKLVHIVKEWLRTEHPEGNVQSLVHLILIFVEQREKQIQIDSEQIRALQKQNGELTDRVKELEEKLKKETAHRIRNFNKAIEWKEKHRTLKKENAELKEKQKWLGSSTKCWFSNSPCRSCDEHDERLRRLGLCYIDQLTKAREIILRLYNAGRDVLMCRAEEKAYDNLSNAINDKSIEQFLKELDNGDEEKRS